MKKHTQKGLRQTKDMLNNTKQNNETTKTKHKQCNQTHDTITNGITNEQ